MPLTDEQIAAVRAVIAGDDPYRESSSRSVSLIDDGTLTEIQKLADSRGWRIDLAYGIRHGFGLEQIPPKNWVAHMEGWVGVDPSPSVALSKCLLAASSHLAMLGGR